MIIKNDYALVFSFVVVVIVVVVILNVNHL